MSAIAENDSKGRAQFYTRVYDAYQAMLTLAAGAIIFLVQPLSAVVIDYSLDPAYERAYLYTPTLVIAVLFMCFNQFLSSIYTVTKHTKNSFYSSFAAAVINLCLNGFLIADHGIVGAIVATIASYLVCYIIRVRDTGRFIRFRINHLRTAANLGILTVMCAVTHYTDKSLATPMPAMVSVLLNTLCMIGLAVINFNPLMTTFKKVLRR